MTSEHKYYYVCYKIKILKYFCFKLIPIAINCIKCIANFLIMKRRQNELCMVIKVLVHTGVRAAVAQWFRLELRCERSQVRSPTI